MMEFKEEDIVVFLKKFANRADYILSGKKLFFLLRGMRRFTFRAVPVIYALCALVGWSFDPAEWGMFVRSLGVLVLIFLYAFALVSGSAFLDQAKSWLEQHGKEAIFRE